MDIPYPKTIVTFEFKLTPSEIAIVAKDMNSILNLPDSRPAPEVQEPGYVHNVGASLSSSTHKIFETFMSQAEPEDLNLK